jgi:hypothetical protein
MLVPRQCCDWTVQENTGHRGHRLCPTGCTTFSLLIAEETLTSDAHCWNLPGSIVYRMAGQPQGAGGDSTVGSRPDNRKLWGASQQFP